MSGAVGFLVGDFASAIAAGERGRALFVVPCGLHAIATRRMAQSPSVLVCCPNHDLIPHVQALYFGGVVVHPGASLTDRQEAILRSRIRVIEAGR